MDENPHKKIRIRFIINPISGIGRQKKIPAIVQRHMDAERFDYEFVETKAAAHAVELAREAAEQGFDVVVAIGGDGSINEVSRGLIGTNTALGIIPAGSGNGLSHFLKIPLNTEKALKKLSAMKVVTIDTATLNGKLLVSVAGLGFDAWVAEKFAHCSHRGFFAYAKVIVREYIFYQPKRYKIYVNGRTLRRKALMITLANSDQFGFNARIAPTASLNDNLLDVCILKKPPVYLAPFVLPLLFFGLAHKTPFLEIIKSQEVKIIQRKNYVMHIDGDYQTLGREMDIKVQPMSLKIIVP